jgi:Ca2+-binding RTX toxin-like protein
VYDADNVPVHRINSAEFLKISFDSGVITGPEAVAVRDKLIAGGRITNPSDPTKPGYQNWPTDDYLNSTKGRIGLDPTAIDAGKPAPHGFITAAEDAARARALPGFAEAAAQHAADKAALKSNPGSYGPDGRMTPTASAALEALHAAGRALGAAATAYDIGATLAEIYPEWKKGNIAFVTEELGALVGRNMAGWAGAALGFEVGAGIGSIMGPLGALAAGLIGAAAGAFLGVEVGGELGRDFGRFINELRKELRDAPDDPWSWVKKLFGDIINPRDPFVLDLDGNGISLTSLTGPQVYFDLDGNGFAERTAWLSPTDGFLALDRNGNGTIDGISDLFGSPTQDAFTMLRGYDSNGDGEISAQDAVFSSLLVWRDANSDGVSQPGELHTLTSLGITSIHVGTNPLPGSIDPLAVRELVAGNIITHRSTFDHVNGTTGQTGAVLFATDQVMTEFQPPVSFRYDQEVFLLPNLRGYGRVPDLWIAMSMDPVLKQMVKDLVQGADVLTSLMDVIGSPITSAGSRTGYETDAFEAMLHRWSKVVPAPASSTEFDAATFTNANGTPAWSATMFAGVNLAIHTMAAFLDRILPDFVSANHAFYEAFQEFSARFALSFYAQVPELTSLAAFSDFEVTARLNPPANGVAYSLSEIETLFNPILHSFENPPPRGALVESLAGLRYNMATDRLDGSPDLFIQAQLASLAFDPEAPWAGYDAWYAQHRLFLELVDPDATRLLTLHRAHTENMALPILRGPHNLIEGTAGDDTLLGDPTSSATNTDLLVGGPGNDIIQGGMGNDTYIFSDGSGADWVSDSGGVDEIAFQGALLWSLAQFSFANGGRQDLLITFSGRSETVMVAGYFDGNGRATIEAVTFADMPQAAGRKIHDAVYATLATTGSDAIVGPMVATTLIGLAGDDVLTGRHGNDILIGGVGNDVLSGGGGDDIYRFERGDGADIVRDDTNSFNGWGGNDTIEFGDGILPAEVTVKQVNGGWDLLLSIAGTSDSITIEDSVGSVHGRIEQVRFANGTVWTHAKLMEMALAGTAGPDQLWGSSSGETISGGAGDDFIDARGGNDVLIGGTGDDVLSGGGGNDVYRYARGDGNDLISDAYGSMFGGTGGHDRLELTGIGPEDLTVVRTADDSYILYIGGGNEGSIKLWGAASEAPLSPARYQIEQIVFSDHLHVLPWTPADLKTKAVRVGNGDDLWVGYDTGETVRGLFGDDELVGRGGDDVLRGDDGNDRLYGGTGDDILSGGAGDDILVGDDPGERIAVGPNLIVNGGFEQSGTIVGSGSWGKANSDLPGWVKSNSQHYEQVVSGWGGVISRDGDYWLDMNSGGGVGTNMDISQTVGGLGEGEIVQLQFAHANFITSASGAFEVYWNGILVAAISDTGLVMRVTSLDLVAAAGDNILRFRSIGGTGHSGASLDDVRLYATVAGSGADYLDGGEGGDTMAGGRGSDIYIVDSAEDVVIEAFDGGSADEVRTSISNYTLPANVEILRFTGLGAATLYGNSLDNLIFGGPGKDTIIVNQGGTDTIQAGAGDDTIYFGAAFTAAASVNGGSGVDAVILQGSYSMTFTAANLNAVERLVLMSGGATPAIYNLTTVDANVAAGVSFFVNGGGLLEGEGFIFVGLAETDGRFWIQGGAGADTLVGGGLEDALFGGAGDDLLYGMGGADSLTGGGGKDTLRGGLGADRYIFGSVSDSTPSAFDTIVDFHAGEKIELAAIDADGNSANGDSAFTWIGAAAFSYQAGQLRAYQQGGAWWVEGDTNGDGVADLLVKVVTIDGTILATTDFVL